MSTDQMGAERHCSNSSERVRLNGQQASLNAAVFGGLKASPDPVSWEGLAALAKIVATPDKDSIRTVITGRKHIVSGRYASRKARRALPYEGMNEPAFFMHSEVDTNVVDYRAQPFRFEFLADGVLRRYIPDCVRLLADGSVEVVEVKFDHRMLEHPKIAAQLSAARRVCEHLGWSFRVVTSADLRRPKTQYDNIVQIQQRRMVKFDASDTYVACDYIQAAGGEVELGGLAEALGDKRVGLAIAQAMMVSRLIKIDLRAPLSAASSVTLVEGVRP